MGENREEQADTKVTERQRKALREKEIRIEIKRDFFILQTSII